MRRDADDSVVASGLTTLELSKNTNSDNAENYNRAGIYKADFSEVSEPGTFYCYLVGIGRSHPIIIKANAVSEHFTYFMAGWYNARSGIAQQSSIAGWDKPADRPFGAIFRKTTLQILHTREGLAGGNAPDAFPLLVAADTGETTTAGWGGHHDAGDWDRRGTQGLYGPLNMIIGYLCKPDFWSAYRLKIPESGGSVPDVLVEAKWALDFFLRIQESNGGVRGGAEAGESGIAGEVSWDDTRTWYLYAPDPFTSGDICGMRCALFPSNER